MFKIIISTIAFLIMIGCAPVPVYRLNSLEKDKNIYKGVETVMRNDSTARIMLRFENQSQDNYEFYLSVTNNAWGKIEFDPKNIYSKIVKNSKKQSDGKYFAIDPEKKLKKSTRI